MDYIKVVFEKVGPAYQEVENGTVLRYLDMSGNQMFEQPPVDDGCAVVDDNPPREAWMQ